MSGLDLLTIGTDVKLSTTAAVDSLTEFESLRTKGIMDFTAAMKYVNITQMMNQWRNSINVNTLNSVVTEDRIYYLFNNVNGESDIVIPDFLIIEGSVELISSSEVELTVEVANPTELDSIKNFLSVSGIPYSIKT